MAEAILAPEHHDACLDHDALTSHVQAWLGKGEIDVPITIEVKRESGAEGVLSLVIRRGGESPTHKTFDVLPVECTNRLKAVSLAIALAIDHTVLESPSQRPELRENVVALRENPFPTTTVVEAQEPSPTSRRLSVQVGGSFLAGVLPRPAFAASGGLALRFQDRLAARLTGVLTQRVESALAPGTAITRLFAARLDGCFDQPLGAIRGMGCLGLSGGVVSATGQGFSTSLTTRRPWLGTIGRVSTRFPADSAVGVQLALDGWVSILRPRFHVMDSEGQELEAHTLPALAGSVSLELVVDVL